MKRYTGENFFWKAETCVVCIRNGKPDKILNCVKWSWIESEITSSTY